MLSKFIDVSNWTAEQWLAALILAFVVVSVLVLLYRMIGIFGMARKTPYKPNLRPLRRSKNPEKDD